MRMIIWALALSCLPVTPIVAQQRSGRSDESATDMKALSQQTEIMRRVMLKSLNKRFSSLLERDKTDGEENAVESTTSVNGSAYSDAQVAYTYATSFPGGGSADFTSFTRGFYLPGYGVVITTTLNTPAKVITVKPDDAGDADEWEEAAEGTRGGWSSSGTYTLFGQKQEEKKVEIDDEYAEAAIDTTVKALGKYGARVAALPDDEVIAVAIRMEPSHRKTLSLDSYTIATGSWGFSTVEGDGALNVVIEVSKQQLLDVERGELSVSGLRKRAKVSAYNHDGVTSVSFSKG